MREQHSEVEGGIPAPDDDPQRVTGISKGSSEYGVRDESFVVWMRTAGLPKFRKLYGKIKLPPKTARDIPLVFEIVPNFEVTSFNGKSLLWWAQPRGWGAEIRFSELPTWL